MSAHSTGLLDELRWRGLVADCTHPETLGPLLDAGAAAPITVYAGFDPTASSLHVGNLIPLMLLARLQRAGHRPIAVAGGATGMVGDPSGKKSERTLLTLDVLTANVAAVKGQLERLLDFTPGPTGALLVDNHDWLGPMTLLEFLRDTGKHFSVNMMIEKDSVRARLQEREQGISYTEFSYMLLQSYDYLHLFRAHGCTLQVGGSDQWGNIVTGIDLIRRVEGKETHGLVVPLLLNAAGEKFGKSEGGNVWLNPAMTSPYQFYQFWVRAEDADVLRLLKFFTFVERAEIEALEGELRLAPEKRAAQRRLAFEVTRLVHGAREAESAIKASKVLFGGAVGELGADDWRMLRGEIPTTELEAAEVAAGMPLVDLLVRTGLCPSKGQAKKDVVGGGVYVNNERAADPAAPITRAHAADGRHVLLRKGKANYHLAVLRGE